MEGGFREPKCFLIREEPIRRLPLLVYAASEACRRRSDDAASSMAALPKAISAKCTLCGFALSGEELLVLAEIPGPNEKSRMLKQLRAGHCARESCPSSHYSLLFYEHPQLNWATLLAETCPTEESKPEPVGAKEQAPKSQIVVPKPVRIGAVVGLCLLAWLWWQWRSGGRIPLLREPEHFRVTPGVVNERGE